MKKRGLFLLILPLVTLILELLPYGAVCNFANPEGKPWRQTYSYFSLLPFGYANFAPLFTAIVTCVLLLLLAVFLLTAKRRLLRSAAGASWVAAVLSLGPLVFGISFFSIVGALITLTLLAEAIILSRTSKR